MICAPRANSPLFESPRGFFLWKRSGKTISYELIGEGGEYRVLELSYRDMRQTVELEATQPFYGGLRWWWRCPACDARAAKLYMLPRCYQFKCRVCHDLSYESAQNSGAFYYRLFKMQAARLGVSSHFIREAVRAGHNSSGYTVKSMEAVPVPLLDKSDG
jgi:hypothetical protein